MKNQPEPLKTYKNWHETIKNQSRTIKTNLGLYRVVRGGSGGYRRLPGGSDDFSLQTHTHCIIIYISSMSPLKCAALKRVIWGNPALRLLTLKATEVKVQRAKCLKQCWQKSNIHDYKNDNHKKVLNFYLRRSHLCRSRQTQQCEVCIITLKRISFLKDNHPVHRTHCFSIYIPYIYQLLLPLTLNIGLQYLSYHKNTFHCETSSRKARNFW